MPYSNRTKHRIWYDTRGESGSPVLLVMGFTMRGIAWRSQIDGFAPHHRVAWFDHAGVGESGPIVSRPLTMRHMALDAMGVADELGWERLHVVGISMGGMIAQHIALRFPERLLSVTLAATHPGGRRHVVPPAQGVKYFAQSYRGSREQRLDALGKLLFAPEFRAQNPERAREILVQDFARPPDPRVGLAQAGAIARHDTRPRLKELGRHAPLIIRPGQDNLVDARGSDVLAAGIGSSRLIRFDESGHAVARQCADRFNELVLDYMAGR